MSVLTFPNIKPNYLRTIEMPDYELSNKQFKSGFESVIRKGYQGINTKLKLEYEYINQDEVSSIITFFKNVSGTSKAFLLPETIFNFPDLVLESLESLGSTIRWKFETEPVISLIVATPSKGCYRCQILLRSVDSLVIDIEEEIEIIEIEEEPVGLAPGFNPSDDIPTNTEDIIEIVPILVSQYYEISFENDISGDTTGLEIIPTSNSFTLASTDTGMIFTPSIQAEGFETVISYSGTLTNTINAYIETTYSNVSINITPYFAAYASEGTSTMSGGTFELTIDNNAPITATFGNVGSSVYFPLGEEGIQIDVIIDSTEKQLLFNAVLSITFNPSVVDSEGSSPIVLSQGIQFNPVVGSEIIVVS